MTTFNQLLNRNKFDVYIEEVGGSYYLYLLIGDCRFYATEHREVRKMWYDFPEGSREYETRCHHDMFEYKMEETKLSSMNPGILFRTS